MATVSLRNDAVAREGASTAVGTSEGSRLEGVMASQLQKASQPQMARGSRASRLVEGWRFEGVAAHGRPTLSVRPQSSVLSKRVNAIVVICSSRNSTKANLPSARASVRRGWRCKV